MKHATHVALTRASCCCRQREWSGRRRCPSSGASCSLSAASCEQWSKPRTLPSSGPAAGRGDEGVWAGDAATLDSMETRHHCQPSEPGWPRGCCGPAWHCQPAPAAQLALALLQPRSAPPASPQRLNQPWCCRGPARHQPLHGGCSPGCRCASQGGSAGEPMKHAREVRQAWSISSIGA